MAPRKRYRDGILHIYQVNGTYLGFLQDPFFLEKAIGFLGFWEPKRRVTDNVIYGIEIFCTAIISTAFCLDFQGVLWAPAL